MRSAYSGAEHKASLSCRERALGQADSRRQRVALATIRDGKRCPSHHLCTAPSRQEVFYLPLQKQVSLCICAMQVQKVSGKSTSDPVLTCTQTPPCPSRMALLGRLYAL